MKKTTSLLLIVLLLALLPLALGATLALSLALGARNAVGAVRAGHLDGDLLLGVLRVGLEVVLDLGASLQGDKAVLRGLLNLLWVELSLLFVHFEPRDAVRY